MTIKNKILRPGFRASVEQPCSIFGAKPAGVLFFLLLLIATRVVASAITLPDGGRYDGELKKGRLHGNGQLVWSNGDRYEGQFRDGRMHGRGVFIGVGGDRYEGQFHDGRMQGRGVFIGAGGDRYEGQMSAGKPQGKGVKVYADGSRARSAAPMKTK